MPQSSLDTCYKRSGLTRKSLTKIDHKPGFKINNYGYVSLIQVTQRYDINSTHIKAETRKIELICQW